MTMLSSAKRRISLVRATMAARAVETMEILSILGYYRVGVEWTEWLGALYGLW